MPATYRFQVSLPVTSALPRDRMTNVLHFEHVIGGQNDAALSGMCSDIAAMYQKRYHNTTKEVNVKAYDTDAAPNLPRANVTVNAGQIWLPDRPREVALCLSFAGTNRGDRRGRGRIYLCPQLDSTTVGAATVRPSNALMQWALDFFGVSNESLPDIGGVDWKFGVYSRVGTHFTQAQQAWVDDEWDVQRRRGLRETTRLTSVREG